VLLRQDFGGRHERRLQSVLHRDERREQCDDRLACADVALQQPVHRPRALQVLHDLLHRVPLTCGQLERKHPPGGLANPIVDVDHHRLLLARRESPPGDDARLKQKRFLEDQPLLRRRREAVQRLDRNVLGRKVRGEEGRVA
jgi:hypothetical protein